MRFLKRVLATKVEEVEDHSKKMFSKYKAIVSQLNHMLSSYDSKIDISDDHQAKSYNKY